VVGRLEACWADRKDLLEGSASLERTAEVPSAERDSSSSRRQGTFMRLLGLLDRLEKQPERF
jgi:hypothetical protein